MSLLFIYYISKSDTTMKNHKAQHHALKVIELLNQPCQSSLEMNTYICNTMLNSHALQNNIKVAN